MYAKRNLWKEEVKIMKKAISFIVVFTLITGILLTGCGQSKEEGKGETTAGTSQTTGAKVDETEGVKVPSVSELVFPDELPSKPVKITADKYNYDDMSKKYSFEILTHGYGVSEPDPNPITEYLSKKYNADITFTTCTIADMETVISTRFAASDYPDVVNVYTGIRNVAFALSEQNLLMDAINMLPYMPNLMQFTTKGYKDYGTYKGKMAGITRYAIQGDDRSFAIRTDWLKKFGMDVPKNEEELFAYARACTFNDPDGNNKADTWFMGGAGGGTSFGMLDAFRSMYGHPSYNVKDGKINHPMLDGTNQKFLQLIRKFVEEGLLVPDWYTVDWEKFKTYIMNDKVGVVHYPGYHLMLEYYNAKGQDETVLNNWDFIQPPIPGGKYPIGGWPGYLLLFSNKLEKDPGKMMRIAHIIDNCMYMGDDYFATIQGGGNQVHPNAGNVEQYNDDGTFTLIIDQKKHPGYNGTYGTNNLELASWQTIGLSLRWWKFADPGFGERGAELNKKSNEMPRWENYDMSLTLDPAVAPTLDEYVRTNEIKFVMGERSFDEWDKYVQEWLDKGGSKLLEEAAKQLNVGSYK